MTDPDPNSAEAWDKLWYSEGGIRTWRHYPKTFLLIRHAVGSNQKVLDVGCGVGLLAAQLKDAGNRVRGLDISPYAIAVMKTEFDIDGMVFDMKRAPTPFLDKEFDWCVSTEFLEHFLPSEADKIVAEIARIGKRAIFVVPNNSIPKSQCKEHNNVFTFESLEDMLKKHYSFVHIKGFRDMFGIDESRFNNGIVNIENLIAICGQEEVRK